MNPFVADDIRADARVFVLLGVLLGSTFNALLVLFIGGEILSDPGGAQGVLLVVLWLAGPLLLTALALLNPGVAHQVLWWLVGLVLAASLATIPLAGPAWEFEDKHGPINLMVFIGAQIPLVALGRALPGRAGAQMIALIVGFVVCQAISLMLAGQWLVIVVFAVLVPPYTAAAILLLLGGRNSRQSEGSR